MLTRSIDRDDPFELTFEEKFFDRAKRICVGFAVVALTISGLDLMNIRPLESAAEFVHANRNARAGDWPGLITAGLGSVAFAAQDYSVTVAIPDGNIAMQPRVSEKPATMAALAPAPEAKRKIATTPKIEAKFEPKTEAKIDTKLAPKAAPKIEANSSPLAELKTASKPDSIKFADALVEDLAAARHLDALEVAMDWQPVVTTAVGHETARAEVPHYTAAAQAPRKEANPPSLFQLASLDPGIVPRSVAPEPPPIALPATLAVLPPPAPGAPPPSPAQRLKLEGAERAKAERCLANAIYFESRDQPVKGQIAVAQVVINRVFSPFYPNNVCDVVYQNAHRRLACQFTFACDGKPDVVTERGPWARAKRLARQMLDGQLYVPAVGTATHYHAVYVHPVWVREMRKLVREGVHAFYRPIAWGSGADAPIWARAQLAARKKQ